MSNLQEVIETDYSDDDCFYSDEELVFDPRNKVYQVYEYIKDICKGSIYPLFDNLTEDSLLSFMYPDEELN